MSAKPHILNVHPHSWRDWLARRDAAPYTAGQILDWIYKKMVADPEAMTNVSKALRAEIAREFDCALPRVKRTETSADGKTCKTAFALKDSEVIESVLMDQGGRHTFCISTQAGCALGCRFCATGRNGFGRNLSAQEILGQVMILARECGGVGNIVFMGMGEPLLNMDALLPALEALVDPQRFSLGRRRITVSTAGIVSGIRELSRHDSRPNLALSLNSPFDEQRSALMPVGRSNPLGEVIDACEEYASVTGRRLLLEYVMLGGINTSRAAAEALAGIALRLGAAVNLIAFNAFEGAGFTAPDRDEIAGFRSELEKDGVVVTQRYRRGGDIAAGCGQLTGS